MKGVTPLNLRRTLYLLLAALCVLFITTSVMANGRSTAVFTVTTAVDEDDGSCTQSHCTLREAIQAANALEYGNAIIQFKVGDLTSVLIAPTAPLPAITTPLLLKTNLYNTIDVTIDGSEAGVADGLTLLANNITVRDLIIQNFVGSGMVVAGNNSLIERNILIGNGGTHTVKLYTAGGAFIKDLIPMGTQGLATPNAVTVRNVIP